MTEFVFDCPHCSACVTVDSGVRELLVTDGCVACGRTVTAGAFRAEQ